ncbi:MAG: VWA domain-containing protein [Bacteroidota bacterium]
MNKQFSILLAFLLLSIYHVPAVKSWIQAQSIFSFWTMKTTPPPAPPVPFDTKIRIQLALLLDTSSSMDGLIGQAKSQLWKMVNELAETTKDGQTPQIEIALYEYGNDDLLASQGYIRQVVPLSTDLDLISEQLFALSTNGGEEYCGYVLKSAMDELAWSNNDNNLKMIFIAGNEAFNQGPVDFRKISKAAATRGILINTIFCGDDQEGYNSAWQTGADLANGRYLVINHNDEVAHIETPYDDQINVLNQALNKTYLGYGTMGMENIKRQQVEDHNAQFFGKANARQRASFKSKKAYSNGEWDIVDAVAEQADFLEEEEEVLPPVLQELELEEREAYVAQLRMERTEIQEKIKDLNEKADTYTQNQQANKQRETLDNVMIETIRQQAQQKSFDF